MAAPQNYPRHDSESSTSSGEGYCNNSTSRLSQSNFPGFSSERNHLLEPPNLELAGSRATLPGKLIQGRSPVPSNLGERLFGGDGGVYGCRKLDTVLVHQLLRCFSLLERKTHWRVGKGMCLKWHTRGIKKALLFENLVGKSMNCPISGIMNP